MSIAAIDAISYERDTRNLRVVLRNGRRYLYRNVPIETHTAMVSSFSKDEFFDMYVRGHFEFVRYHSIDMLYQGQTPINPADHHFRR